MLKRIFSKNLLIKMQYNTIFSHFWYLALFERFFRAKYFFLALM